MTTRILTKHANKLSKKNLHKTQATSAFEVQRNTPIIKKVQPIPITPYGGRHMVTMLPGAGIGPELMSYVREVFKHADAPVDFEIIETDPKSENGDLARAITSIKRNGVAIKTNIDTKSIAYPARNIVIRNALDLYVSIIHFKSMPGVPAKHDDIDIVIIRQNTEGEYAMLEHESVKGVVENLKIITRSNSERLARLAFEYAKKHGRKKITTIHKANIMKMSDGLFLETSHRVAKEYPEIKHNALIIDNCCMQLVAKPTQFDIMLMPNLYGSVVSNVVSGLAGGAGLLSGIDYGDFHAVFETATRKIGEKLAGKNKANPIAMLNASVDMLEHLGHRRHAKLIRSAIYKTVCVDKVHTPDLKGSASSTDVVQRIVEHILKNDVEEGKIDVSERKKDVSGRKKDVSGRKKDVQERKKDVQERKKDVQERKKDVEEETNDCD